MPLVSVICQHRRLLAAVGWQRDCSANELDLGRAQTSRECSECFAVAASYLSQPHDFAEERRCHPAGFFAPRARLQAFPTAVQQIVCILLLPVGSLERPSCACVLPLAAWAGEPSEGLTILTILRILLQDL